MPFQRQIGALREHRLLLVDCLLQIVLAESALTSLSGFDDGIGTKSLGYRQQRYGCRISSDTSRRLRDQSTDVLNVLRN